MRPLLAPALVGAGLLSAGQLATRYAAERTFKVTAETELSLETTHFAMERDGEPVEGGRFGGGGGMQSTQTVTCVDTVLAAEEGRPTKVRRRFEEVSGSISMGEGERAREIDRESPLDGETLVLTLDDEGDVVAELEDGGEPDAPGALQGHSLTLALDALLPEGEVDAGDSWEPEGADLMRALLMDVEPALFPPQQREEGGDGERGGRGRGGFGRGGGGSRLGFFRDAEWDAKATLTDRREDVDGVSCVVIELEFEAEGDLPERTFGRERDPFDLAAFAPVPWRVVDNTYEVQLEGTLLFSVDAGRPVQLTLEGTITLETSREGERGGVSFSTESTQEGTFEHTITVKEEDA